MLRRRHHLRARVVWGLGLTLVLVACNFELPDLSSAESAPGDSSEAVTGVDAGADPKDASATDAEADAQVPPPVHTCEALYGAIPGYLLCQELEGECHFNARLDERTSCTALCEAAGGRCLSAIDNQAEPEHCKSVREGTDSCDREDRETQLCICARR